MKHFYCLQKIIEMNIWEQVLGTEFNFDMNLFNRVKEVLILGAMIQI